MSISLETALLDLQYALLEKGVHLEFIKVDGPVLVDGDEVDTLHGVKIKTIIRESDAEVWP